jgi:hypothetical protein
MLKHIGRHGDRKVAIIFRELPGEDHMCLVIYPETLPTHIHNTIMGILESAPGQASPNLADVCCTATCCLTVELYYKPCTMKAC